MTVPGHNGTPTGTAKPEIDQEEKPHTAVIAAFINHGHIVRAAALAEAISLDDKHKISSKFAASLQPIDNHFQLPDASEATDKPPLRPRWEIKLRPALCRTVFRKYNTYANGTTA